MVKQASLKFGIALVGISLGACPALADNLLEQMQNEVATVAGRARSCIVSIEDARAIVVSYNNSSLEKSDLQNQVAHLQADRNAARTQAAQAEERYRSGLMTALEVEKSRRELARVETRLAFLQQTLTNFGREDIGAQQKRELDVRIAELEIDRKFYDEQIKILQAQVANGVSAMPDLQASRQQQTHIMLDLNAAQAQRKVWGQNLPEGIFFSWDDSQANTPKSGSGFSVGEGYIVTTADVVQGMSSPIVTADDGRRIRAMLVAVDGERNVGLVRLVANVTLPGLTLGDSDRVMPGHFAISIGNQVGQYNSVALGVVSGLRAQGFYSGAHFYPNLLQVDGAIGAGTSGAPILNARGEVIGMIAAVLAADPSPSASSGYADGAFQMQNRFSMPFAPLNSFGPNAGFNSGQARGQTRTTTGQAPTVNMSPATPQSRQARGQSSLNGLLNATATAPRSLAVGNGTGFAIPINAMKDVIEELKAGKDIVHVWMGVSLEDVDNAQEENGAIRINRQARIRGIYASSPALKVGLQAGDVLLSLDGRPVRTASEVRAALLPMRAGRKVSATVRRGAKTVTVSLTLETPPTPRPALLTSGLIFRLSNPASAEKKTPASP